MSVTSGAAPPVCCSYYLKQRAAPVFNDVCKSIPKKHFLSKNSEKEGFKKFNL